MPLAFTILSNDRYILHEILAYPGKYLYPHQNSSENQEYYDICSHQIDETFKNFFFKVFVLIYSMITAAIWPTYQYISYGTKTTAIALKFPFVDANSDGELLGNLLFQCVLLTHGAFAYLGIEIGLEIITDSILTSRKLLLYRLGKLFDQHKTQSFNDSELFYALRNIVQHVREFDK